MKVLFPSRVLKNVVLAAVAATCLSLCGTAARAETPFVGTLGQKVYAHGHVKVEIRPSESGFTNIIALLSPTFQPIGLDNVLGPVVDLGTFSGSPELVFGIFSPHSIFSGGSYGIGPFSAFVTGPGTRNGDGLTHGSVNFINANTADIGFEDLYGPYSDRDFNDAIIRVSGVSASPTPEPASLALLATGALPLLRRRLRRRQPVEA